MPTRKFPPVPSAVEGPHTHTKKSLDLAAADC
jgi:hypothetical protein